MQLVSTQLEHQLFTAGSKLLENIPPTQATLFQHVKQALLQASFYWHQATLVQQNIPDFSEWGWQKDGASTWQPLRSTLSNASVACSILLHCGCPKACTGRSKCNRAGDRYTALANVKECFIVNKTQLVSFFVYRRKSRDRFRIVFRYINSDTISGLHTCLYFYGNNLFLFQTLEYSGRGKSIHDVGLAQAKHPLDTMNHYFEIEVMDPGESCYIAIGVARRVR